MAIDDLYTRDRHALISRYKTTEVEIGDVSAPGFVPQVRYKKWGADQRETHLALRFLPPDAQAATVVEVGDRLVWRHPDIWCRWYDVGFRENGGFEFDVVLRRAPATNVVRFAVQSNGLQFLEQGPLTTDELLLGAIRPDNALNSYAIYHASRQGNQYRAGKFGHLYRPLARDANGVPVWCDMALTPTLLTVTVPQLFLDTATYPVTVDPTLGYTTVGASIVTLIANYMATSGTDASNGYTAVENGTIANVFFYGDTNGLDVAMTMGVYNQGSSVPGTLLANGAGATINAAAGAPTWFSQAVSGSLVSGNKYYPAERHGTNTFRYRYDSSTNTMKYAASTYSAGVLPDPFPSPTSFSGKLSAYIEYTASGGAFTPRSMLLGVG